MDISFLPFLQPKTDLYVERFAAFEANANQRQKVSEWINDRFDDEITFQLLDSVDENVTLSALGIGCGDGRLYRSVGKYGFHAPQERIFLTFIV